MSDPKKGVARSRGRRHLSPRGWGLALMGLACLLRAWSYLEPGLTAPPNQLTFVSEYLPVTSYALLWAVTGVILFVSVFVRRVIPWALGLFAGMHLMWALSFFSAWAFLGSPRAWVSAISYVTLAGLAPIIARLIDPQDVLTPRERARSRASARLFGRRK